MTNYIEVAPDLEKWEEFVSLAQNEIFPQEKLTVFYDEAAPHLATELMIVGSQGRSMSIYLSPDTIQDFRMDIFSNSEAYATANAYWKE